MARTLEGLKECEGIGLVGFFRSLIHTSHSRRTQSFSGCQMGGLSSALVTHGLAGWQVMSSLLNSAVAKRLFKPESIQTVNFIDNFKVANLLVRCVVFFHLVSSMPDCVMSAYIIKTPWLL